MGITFRRKKIRMDSVLRAKEFLLYLKEGGENTVRKKNQKKSPPVLQKPAIPSRKEGGESECKSQLFSSFGKKEKETST